MKQYSAQYKITLLKRGSLLAIFDKYYKDIPENIKIKMRKESSILVWKEEGNQPPISTLKVLFQLLKENIDGEKQETLEREIQEAIRKIERSFHIEDINMPNTKISSIRNKVAEQMAHGLNAKEILKDLTLITRPELVRVIMDLIENPVVVDGGSKENILKIFAVTEYFPAGAGFKVTIVKASSIEDAFTKYTRHTSYKCSMNLNVKEVVGEVCEIVTFDNPHNEE